jgi:hypothetical protein
VVVELSSSKEKRRSFSPFQLSIILVGSFLLAGWLASLFYRMIMVACNTTHLSCVKVYSLSAFTLVYLLDHMLDTNKN